MIFLHSYECKENAKVLSRKKLLENLSHYLGKSVQEVNIQYNENGKPQVNGVYFSVSHCREKIIQIFSTDTEIGADIEFKNNKRPFLNLAQRYFHPNESEYLSKLPIEDATDLFYNLWTAKEAVCKAHGGRLWYYLADNYLTCDLNMSSVINGMNLQHFNRMRDFSLCIASSGKIENVKYV